MPARCFADEPGSRPRQPADLAAQSATQDCRGNSRFHAGRGRYARSRSPRGVVGARPQGHRDGKQRPARRRIVEQASKSRYRSIYLPLLRGLTPTSLEVFDFAEQGMVSGSRDTTTVPVQALYLLNDPFVRRQSLFLAERLLGRTTSNIDDSIDQAYRLTLGRPASESEIERAKAYLAKYESSVRAVVATPHPRAGRAAGHRTGGGRGREHRQARAETARTAAQSR